MEGGVYNGNIFLFIVYKIGEIYGRLASEEKLTQDYKIESFYSYTYYEKQYKYAPDIGLINGFGGIGMTLLSIINKDKKNEWDNIFML